MIQIDRDLCNDCAICHHVCPNYVFALNTDGGSKRVSIRYPDLCYECDHCIALCPTEAIFHDTLSKKDFEPISKIGITTAEMRNLMLSRRSTRAFKPAPVPEQAIQQLLGVAVQAGSSGNLHTEEFLIVKDRQFMHELERLVVDTLWNNGLRFFVDDGFITRALSKKYGPELTHLYKIYHKIIKRRKENDDIEGMIFRDAPLLIVVHELKLNFLGHANCAIAIRNIEFLALTMGLATCWAGFLITAASKNKKISRLLGVDKSREIYGALMVGYPKYHYDYALPRRERELRSK